ncbi:MAG: hypothetical protein ACM4D3_21170 [Candidatus Sericytochromatia bacterium]
MFAILAALVTSAALASPVAYAKPTKPPGSPGNAPLTMILIGGNDDPTSNDFATRLLTFVQQDGPQPLSGFGGRPPSPKASPRWMKGTIGGSQNDCRHCRR